MAVLKNKKGVVIAQVEGGLGNQLFIYAAAKRLALRNDGPLKLDVVSGYAKDVYDRAYCLHHFNISAEVASLYDSYMSSWGDKRRYMARKINRLLPFSLRFYISEEKAFDKRLLEFNISRKVYLRGYWQDERYFKDIEDIIRKEYQINGRHREKNVDLAKKIKTTNSVCLHARRIRYEYALNKGYYAKAVGYMLDRVQNPHFFCFSDKPEWIMKNIDIPSPVDVITHNTDGLEHEDLWLMSQCKHYIIANSSFSWWGAWLNPRSDKIVIAPSNWGYDTAIPEDWVAITS
jgi:hypothetical protein